MKSTTFTLRKWAVDSKTAQLQARSPTPKLREHHDQCIKRRSRQEATSQTPTEFIQYAILTQALHSSAKSKRSRSASTSLRTTAAQHTVHYYLGKQAQTRTRLSPLTHVRSRRLSNVDGIPSESWLLCKYRSLAATQVANASNQWHDQRATPTETNIIDTDSWVRVVLLT
jgi:hypothetical protein